MTTKTRLALSFGAILMLLVAVAIFSVNRIDYLSGLTAKMYRHPFAVTNAVYRADANIIRMHRSMKDVALCKTTQEIDTAVAAVAAPESKVYEDLALLKERFLGDPAMVDRLNKAVVDWKPIRDRVIALMREDKREEAAAITRTEGAKQVAEISEAVKALAEFSDEKAEHFRKDAEEARVTTLRSVLALVAVALAAALALAILVTRNILGILGGEPASAALAAKLIAEGDLTHTLALKPGNKHSLMACQQQMIDGLKGIIGNISSSVVQAEQAAQSLASASQQVAGASGQASESAASMAASVEELSVSVGQVSDNARSALDVAERAGQLSMDGGKVIEEAIAKINGIAETVRATSANMASLSDSSSKISLVVNVIKEVADQTNLLALNAAIEAARAGEAGRGFAVVADEVRKLAERTTKATGEISATISHIQTDTQSSVEIMEAAVGQVDAGVGLASQAGEAIKEIRVSVEHVVSAVNDIVNAISEQSTASQQIAEKVEQVAQTSEENNFAAQNTAASAAQLSALAEELRVAIKHFRT